MDANDWVNVGSPLIEQDAEYLLELIRRQGYPAQIVVHGDSALAEAGRTHIVQVRRMHRRLALEIRANEFPEPATKEPKPEKVRSPRAMRLWKSTAAAVVGLMAGLRVGVRLRGGALATVGVGLCMGMLAFFSVFMLGAPEDGKKAESAATEGNDDKA